MTSAPTDHLQELLQQSFLAWRLIGSVGAADDGAMLVCCGAHRIRIERAPPDLPFRWMVIIGERRRGAVSVVAVLRQVRTALDPGYAAMPARVTAFPLLPP